MKTYQARCVQSLSDLINYQATAIRDLPNHSPSNIDPLHLLWKNVISTSLTPRSSYAKTIRSTTIQILARATVPSGLYWYFSGKVWNSTKSRSFPSLCQFQGVYSNPLRHQFLPTTSFSESNKKTWPMISWFHQHFPDAAASQNHTITYMYLPASLPLTDQTETEV